jgi:cytosine/creatinine deaminase
VTGAASLWLHGARLPRWTLGTADAPAALHDLLLVEGQIAAVQASAATPPPGPPGDAPTDERSARLAAAWGRARRVDLAGAVVLPGLIEAHAHLDKAYTVHRAPPTGPGLLAAIEATTADSARWTEDDLRQRGRRGLREARASGVRTLRSHVNWWQAERPLAWSVLAELGQDAELGLALELVNISPLTLFADAPTADQVARAVAATPGGVLGAFVHTQNHDDAALRRVFALAAEHGLRIDLHADEELDPAARGVARAAELTLEYGLQGRVACSHACALAVQDEALALHTLDAVARAGLTLISLPSTNLLLQDAQTGRTPRQRGLTLVQEARARGIAVLVGSDNVQDAFSPQGRHDPLAALGLACLVGHLSDPLDEATRLIADPAALGGGQAWHGWTGAAADLLICRSDAPAGQHSPLAFPSDVVERIVLQAGQVVAGQAAWRAMADGTAA